MTNLTENSIWESGIYQLETDDPTLGGPPGFNLGEPVTGHANAQAQQLANRTNYLKNRIDNDLSDATEPNNGAGMIGYTSLIRQETVYDTLTRHELTGQDNDIPVYQGNNAGAARLFIGGVDSLTEGAAGSNWHKYFKKIMRGQLGDGGPGLCFFELQVATDEAAEFGFSGLSSISENDGIFYQYSLAGKGIYTLAGAGTPFMNWKPASAWTNARVFYLKQPSGGTFKVGTNDSVGPSGVVVDTNNTTIQLGYVDVPLGVGTDGRILSVRNVTGRVALFAALFTNSTTGFLWGDIAKGGRKLADVANQDSSLRREWFAALQPTHFLLNGGTNDRTTRTGLQHASDLNIIIDDVQISSPSTNIVIIQQNHISGEASTYLPEHAVQKINVARSQGIGYFDVRKLLGSYAYASANGLMADTIHPSDKANKIIAAYYADRLGFSANSSDPGATPYASGAAAEIQKTGSLSTKKFSANSGVKTTVYTLALVNGFPIASFNLRISCNRNGTGVNTVKDAIFTVSNQNINNYATGTTTPTVIQLAKELASGDGLGIDFTVTTEIISNKCVVSVTPSGFTGNFIIEGSYAMTYNTVAGPAVFES